MSGILSNLLDDVSNLGSRSIQESRYLRQQKQLDALRTQSAQGVKKTLTDAEDISPLGVDAARRAMTAAPADSVGRQIGVKPLSEMLGAKRGQSLAASYLGAADGQTAGQKILGLDAGKSIGEQLMNRDAGQSIGAKLAGGQAGQSIGESLVGARPGQSMGQAIVGAKDGVGMGRSLMGLGPGRTMVAPSYTEPAPTAQPQLHQDWAPIADEPNAGQPPGTIGPDASVLRAMQSARAAVAGGSGESSQAPSPLLSGLSGQFSEPLARLMAAKTRFNPTPIRPVFQTPSFGN